MDKQHADNIRHLINEKRIHTVRVCLHDTSNIQRARFVSSRHFLDKVMQSGIAFPSIMFSLDMSAEVVMEASDGFEGGFPSWLVKPDLATFGIVPYSPGTARVIADVYKDEATALETVPRYVLKKVLSRYRELGIQVKGAFEYEFYIFRKNGDTLEPAWQGLNLMSEVKQSTVEELLLAIISNLSEMGAGPEVANTEYGSGQFEITNSPFWGLEIADMAHYYRTSIREIVSKYGLTATFMAKPVADHSGSGAHIHLSLYDTGGKNLLYDETTVDGLSTLGRSFIAGQLHHGRAMCALVNSNINSYKRLQPYKFAPTTSTWGYEHRGCMVRIPSSRGQNTRIENRLPGADTNPYLSLAAILAAGLDGIEKQMTPPAPQVNADPYASNTSPLPKTLEEAMAALNTDDFFRSALGSEFITQYLLLRRNELNRFNNWISDWEFKEYLELL